MFEKYALQCAEEIFKENNIAVMVGGTGLYIKTFCEGIDEMPNISAFVRNNIIQQYNQNGLSWLQNEVKIKDNFFWQTAEQQNPQRLMRALEIITATGKSITNFKQNKKIKRPFNIIKIGLELPKEQLYNNINNRVDIMMNDGLLNEVKSLIQFKNLNALQTVGYKELFNYFNENCSLQQAVNKIKINTRHYAKRQLTWFKKDTAIQWHNAATVNANLVANLLK